MKRISCMVLLALTPILVNAKATCEERLFEIDERLALGSYPADKVALAKQMRDSMAATCGMLDENMLDNMMLRIDEILPPDDPDAKPMQLDAQTAADDPAAAGKQPPAEKILQPKAATGHSVAVGYVDRAEDMLNFWTWDWDLYQGNARVLYMSSPMGDQTGLPDSKISVYVVEITPQGEAKQHLITAKKEQDIAAMALRRGHDEVFVQRAGKGSNEPSTLELWSIADAKQLSTVPVPNPAGPDGSAWDWMPFRVATSDGNVLFFNGKSDTDKLQLAWFKASPEGKVEGEGSLTRPGETLKDLSFSPTDNGGAGVILGLAPLSSDGFSVGGETPPIVRRGEGLEIQVKFNYEKRILTIGGSMPAPQVSVPIERRLVVTNNILLNESGKTFTKQELQQTQLKLINGLEREYQGNYSTSFKDLGFGLVQMIKPLDSGEYAVIAQEAAGLGFADDAEKPHFVKIASEKVAMDVDLSGLANELDVNFNLFAPGPGGAVYLYGSSRKHDGDDYVLLLDGSGHPVAYGRAAQPRVGNINVLLADTGGVWVIGKGFKDEDLTQLRFWSERIDFPSAKAE